MNKIQSEATLDLTILRLKDMNNLLDEIISEYFTRNDTDTEKGRWGMIIDFERYGSFTRLIKECCDISISKLEKIDISSL